MRHFLDLSTVEAADLRTIMDDAHAVKRRRDAVREEAPMRGKVLAMIFDKPSTRTRVSFDVGMRQLGGETIVLDGSSTQLGRGETIADTARVLSRYVDAIMIRTTAHDRLVELAHHATVPVVNGLTDETHPCQIMADVMTYEEHRGPLQGRKVAWTGDGNNVLHSLCEATARFGFALHAAVPQGFEPKPRYVDWGRNEGGTITIGHDAEEAVRDADLVVTDTWVSMGEGGASSENDAAGHNTFHPFQVNEALMCHARDDALFMHCLPAHRNEEVTDAVMDGPQSVVFDEAENRLHAQKAILRWVMGESA